MKKLFTLLMLTFFSIGAWAIEAGKVYTIKAHFSNRNDLYFTVRGGQLCFDQMREASEDIYKWEAVATDHATYPWAFKNVATNKYLNGRGGDVVDAYTTGSNEVGCFKITECSGNYAGYYNLNAVATDRNLGTWSSGDTSSKGFGGSSCYSTGGQNDDGWTTYYEIEEATDAVEWYTLQATATNLKYLYATGAVESGKIYVKQANGNLSVGDIDNYLWKIEGDDANGYKVVNKKTGKFIGCENITANGTTASNTKAILTDNETTDGVYTRFKLGGYQAALQVLNGSAPTGVFINPASNGYSETRFFVANNNGNTQRVKTLAEYIPDVQTTLATAYAKNGCIGYPADMSGIASYSAENGVTKANVLEACDAYRELLSNTNINLPKAGKAYKMYFQCANSAKKYYIQPSGTPSTNAETAVVAVIGDKGGAADAQRFYFVNSQNGEYFSYQGYTNSEYSAPKHDFKIVPINSYNNTSHNNLTLSKERSFGLVFLYAAKRPNGDDNGGVVVSESNGSWSATSDPFFNGSHTSGVVFEEVTFPYNTANLQYDKDAASGPAYSTIYLPFAMTIPADVKAYGVTGTEGDVMVLNRVADGVNATDLPKGAYVLYSETVSGATTIIPAAANPETVSNLLVGSVDAGATLPTGTKWVLGKKEGIGFYKYTGAQYPLGKAIYVNEANANKLSFRFEDVITAIQAVESNNTAAEIFDLQGRRLNKAQKGMNIINGHKVLVK